MIPVDPRLVIELSRAVQTRLEIDATARVESGRPPLARPAQEALADAVLRPEFQRIDRERLEAGLPRLEPAMERALTERVLALCVGLGPADLLLADPTVEEIVATRFDLLFTYHTNGVINQVDERMWNSDAELDSWVSHLARTAGRTERQFNSQVPLLVMRLGDGLRLAATRDVSEHVTFALRRNTLGKVTLADLVGLGMFPQVVADFLRACMRCPESRIVFSGPTGSGKSTAIRACLAELDPLKRIVIIEDTAELDLFDPVNRPNVESWEERLPNNEGEGGISQGDLVRHAVRVRPDVLVAGEVRGSDAAVPMLKAMTHGQASMTTVHSASAIGGLEKLALYLGTGEDRLPPEVAHNQLHQAIDFVVHLDRLADGRRVVTQIIEVSGFDGRRCTTNTIVTRDEHGEVVTMQRLEQRHERMLRRAGFDPALLGGGFR